MLFLGAAVYNYEHSRIFLEKDARNQDVATFLDDILVYGSPMEKHDACLKQVLQRLGLLDQS